MTELGQDASLSLRDGLKCAGHFMRYAALQSNQPDARNIIFVFLIAPDFIGTHKPYNFFAHEYMAEPDQFLAPPIAVRETPNALIAYTIHKGKGEDVFYASSPFDLFKQLGN